MTSTPITSAELSAIATPALVVDKAAMERNIASMAALARQGGVALRPHAKTHKCIGVARAQMRAGAVGIGCATLGEAEALSAGGIPNLLLTAPQAAPGAAARIWALHRARPLTVVCDHPWQVERLIEAAAGEGPPLAVLVDMDIGQRRTGVTTVAEGLELSRAIARQSRLELAGVQGFAGQVQHVVDAAERRESARAAGQLLGELATALRTAGLPCPLVSGSGTGAFAFDMAGPYTELQVGSYVFMDADYARLRQDAAHPFEVSLYVLATVVSVNRPGQVTIDAGTKAFAVNGPPPHRILGAPEGTRFSFAGDEHGVLSLPPGAPAPPLGARMLLSATHVDPTVNLYDAYHVWDEGRPLDIWPIVGRYSAHNAG